MRTYRCIKSRLYQMAVRRLVWGLTQAVSMLIHRDMVTLAKYEIHQASLALRRRLNRENPGVFIYGGINADPPYEIIVKSSRPIKCPDIYEYNGVAHPVIYELRGEHEISTSAND